MEQTFNNINQSKPVEVPSVSEPQEVNTNTMCAQNQNASTNTAQSQEAPTISSKTRKAIIGVGVGIIIALLLLGTTLSLIHWLRPQYDIDKTVHINYQNGGGLAIHSVKLKSEDDDSHYKVYVTKPLVKSTGRRLQTEDHEQARIHVVLEQAGIVVTKYPNGTLRLHVDPNPTLELMIQNNQCLREIVNKYQSDNDEISPEVLTTLKALLHQMFEELFDGEGQKLTTFLGSFWDHVHIQLFSPSPNSGEQAQASSHNRKLWHVNVIGFGSALKSIPDKIDTSGEEADQTVDYNPQSDQEQELHENCIPKNEKELICPSTNGKGSLHLDSI